MKTVGIKYLKDHLSQELQEVRQGETLQVTDRNVVIAEIRQPSSSHRQKVTRLEKWLTAQERAGSPSSGDKQRPIMAHDHDTGASDYPSGFAEVA